MSSPDDFKNQLNKKPNLRKTIQGLKNKLTGGAKEVLEKRERQKYYDEIISGYNPAMDGEIICANFIVMLEKFIRDNKQDELDMVQKAMVKMMTELLPHQLSGMQKYIEHITQNKISVEEIEYLMKNKSPEQVLLPIGQVMVALSNEQKKRGIDNKVVLNLVVDSSGNAKFDDTGSSWRER